MDTPRGRMNDAVGEFAEHRFQHRVNTRYSACHRKPLDPIRAISEFANRVMNAAPTEAQRPWHAPNQCTMPIARPSDARCRWHATVGARFIGPWSLTHHRLWTDNPPPTHYVRRAVRQSKKALHIYSCQAAGTPVDLWYIYSIYARGLLPKRSSLNPPKRIFCRTNPIRNARCYGPLSRRTGHS
jgi:hypothetical protein